MDDASAVAVNRMRDDLAPTYLLPAMPDALPELVADKAELADLCAALGVSHPSTLVPGQPRPGRRRRLASGAARGGEVEPPLAGADRDRPAQHGPAALGVPGP
jgi:hypothetical protein